MVQYIIAVVAQSIRLKKSHTCCVRNPTQILLPENPVFAVVASNTVLAPAEAVCTSPSSSTSIPAPMQSVDAARVNSLEARMNEQSALIASDSQSERSGHCSSRLRRRGRARPQPI
eukprot:1513898-Pleurochrysis_carterae.AAC.1